MRPLLELVADRGEVSMSAVREELAHAFQLEEDDLRERIPSGYTTTWTNRVHWAKTYLYKAGALDNPRRGIITPTERTFELLKRYPGRIDIAVLEQFSEFVAWRSSKRAEADDSTATTGARSNGTIGRARPDTLTPADQLTPLEALAKAHREVQSEVLDELLERISEMSPDAFERLVLSVLGRLGYGGPLGSAEHLGGSGDAGVDGVIREDPLGLELVYLQAKKHAATISRPEVQAFAGSLEGFRARKGVFITTSSFSREARDYVRQIEKRIVLVDGVKLVELMWETGLGVSTEQSFEVKSIDTDFFDSDGL